MRHQNGFGPLRIKRVLDEVVLRYSENMKGALDAEFLLIRYVYRPLSFFPAALLISIGFSANQATVLNLGIVSLAGILFLQGSYLCMLAGAALHCVYQVLDCVDGNIARYRRQASFYGKVLDGCVDTATLLIFIPVAIGHRKLVGASDIDLELVLAVATTIAGLCNAYINQRIAYFTLASGVAVKEAQSAPAKSRAGGLKCVLKKLNKIYENLITSLPVFLLPAVIFGQTPAFIMFFFFVHCGLGLAASVSKLVSIQDRLNVPREF